MRIYQSSFLLLPVQLASIHIDQTRTHTGSLGSSNNTPYQTRCVTVLSFSITLFPHRFRLVRNERKKKTKTTNNQSAGSPLLISPPKSMIRPPRAPPPSRSRTQLERPAGPAELGAATTEPLRPLRTYQKFARRLLCLQQAIFAFARVRIQWSGVHARNARGSGASCQSNR